MNHSTLPEALRKHGEICESLHQVILRENRVLKNTGKAPDEDLLQAKRALLVELTASFAVIRARSAGRATAEIRAAAEKAQQAIMKALLVDRENEQLLLQCEVVPRPVRVAIRPPAAQFQRAYAGAA